MQEPESVAETLLLGHRLAEGWLYLRGDIGNIWEAVRPAPTGHQETVPVWQSVTVPHCFNALDAVDPSQNYYQGPGWYKTLLDPANPFPGGRTLLHFEGAGQRTAVYIHMQKAGSHVGGYDEWQVDITDAVRAFQELPASQEPRWQGQVPLAIRCDNSRDAEMLPSDLSDFNVYGGLYRHVNLRHVPALSLEGIEVDARTQADGAEGRLTVSARFCGRTNVAGARIRVRITDPSGRAVHQAEITGADLAGAVGLCDWRVAHPARWSPDDPALYTCEVELVSEYGTHAARRHFGFRHFEFQQHGPFFLNGSRLLLKGTHRHEDHAGVGAAMTDAQIAQEMGLIKEMGANFIRLGHYQQSRLVLDLCDRLGLLVWEEIPWCRGGVGGAAYREQARRMLRNMIAQHRCHPAVILWGLGNENDWSNDFPHFAQDGVRALMQELHDLAHLLDPERKTAIRRCDFCREVIDVYSPSIWAGWYRGRYTDYRRVSEHEMKRVAHFLHVEWGGDHHAGRHAEDPLRFLDGVESGQTADERLGDAALYGGAARAARDGAWSETYICDLVDWHLKEQEGMDWLTGTAHWLFKDFSTPLRPDNPVPYVNQKGVVQRDLTPKESYFVFQSYWSKKPMVHIYGHTWPVRWGGAGEPRLVKVYSNCAEVELYVNGKSMGARRRAVPDFPAAGFHWPVVFQAGKNRLRAVGRAGAITLEDEIEQEYQTAPWGAEASLRLQVTALGNDLAQADALLIDAGQVPCLDSRKSVRFSLAGDGQLLDGLGTRTGSRVAQAANGRAGIRIKLNHGRSVIAAHCDGLPSAFAEIRP